MRVKTWKVLDYGLVPEGASTVSFSCVCGYEAEMPVSGTPLAQIGAGIVFSPDSAGALPAVVQCRKCRRILDKGGPDVR